jgi:hypothetical protein
MTEEPIGKSECLATMKYRTTRQPRGFLKKSLAPRLVFEIGLHWPLRDQAAGPPTRWSFPNQDHLSGYLFPLFPLFQVSPIPKARQGSFHRSRT